MNWILVLLQMAAILIGLAFSQVSSAKQKANLALIKRIIALKHPKSVEELLSELPPDYRASFTLVHQSRSLQAATPTAPRVILYGQDAKLLIAFTGSISERHGSEIELIQFDDQAKAFDFYKIDFTSPNGARLSERNPSICLKCHESDPRPNWEPYNFWPGLYGGGDDTPGSKIEWKNLQAFLKSAHMNSRYSALVDLEKHYSITRPDATRFDSDPNSTLTGSLAVLNFEREVRLLQGTPDYKFYKYAILGMLGCDPSKEFFPIGVPPFDSSYGKNLYRDVLKNRGISTSGWSLSFDRSDEVTYQTPGVGVFELIAKLTQADPNLKPFSSTYTSSFNGRAENNQVLASVLDCRALAKKSRQELLKLKGNDHSNRMKITLENSKQKNRERVAKLLEKNCMVCHSGSETNTPNLPFESYNALKGYKDGLIQKRLKDGSMPPDERYISPDVLKLILHELEASQ